MDRTKKCKGPGDQTFRKKIKIKGDGAVYQNQSGLQHTWHWMKRPNSLVLEITKEQESITTKTFSLVISYNKFSKAQGNSIK